MNPKTGQRLKDNLDTLDHNHKGRLLRENSFFLKKTFSIIPFFSFSFFL